MEFDVYYLVYVLAVLTVAFLVIKNLPLNKYLRITTGCVALILMDLPDMIRSQDFISAPVTLGSVLMIFMFVTFVMDRNTQQKDKDSLQKLETKLAEKSQRPNI